MQRLSGKIALITGSAMGIGRATAELFAAEGATVIAADLTDPAPFGDPRIDVQRLDVADEDSWNRLMDHLDAVYGRVDVLIGAAGIIDYSPIDTLELATWERVIGVDQTGIFLGMRAVIPRMRAAGGGSIVNFSSDWGVVGGVGVAAYNAAKGAVRSMSRNAAVTYAADGIRVNSMVPGWIRTPLTDRQPSDANDRVIGGTPLGHGGDAIDIAYGCVYLASDEARFVTGTDLVIDGGFLAV